MTSKARDLESYSIQYKALPFEPIQIRYRREVVLRELRKRNPSHFLEIGCGETPLFLDFPGLASTVIEPTGVFAQNARDLTRQRKNVAVHQCYLEDYDSNLGQFDMVIASCVLHEVPDAQRFLAAIRRLCQEDTLVHINVPNARSLHRLLAVAMGLISSPYEASATQMTMQQRPVPYDIDSLRQEVDDAGFMVESHGGIFVKPFTHAQMQSLVDSGFLSNEILEGLGVLGQSYPELSSEVWINARIKK